MGQSAEDMLAQHIQEAVAPSSFKAIEPELADGSIQLIAAWKRKTLNMNRGIALVSLDKQAAHPGEFGKTIKKPIGKFIGYFPFFYELGLQLVLVGRSILDRSTGLEQFLDTVSQSVTLQSIHLVDVAAGELIRNLPADGDVESAIPLPGWAKAVELSGKIKNPFSGGLQRGKTRLRYSAEAGRAAVSVRTWGQTQTGPFIDAIEDGIDRFIRQAS